MYMTALSSPDAIRVRPQLLIVYIFQKLIDFILLTVDVYDRPCEVHMLSVSGKHFCVCASVNNASTEELANKTSEI